MRERDIENHLRREVKKKGGSVFKWSSPGQRGVPDDIIFINGQIWFIEVKRPDGRMSRLQEMFGEFIKDYTANYAVLWSKEDVDKWLADLKAQ